MSKWGGKKWGDVDGDDDDDTQVEEILDSKKGTRKVVETYKNREGQKVKVTKTVKITRKKVRVNRNVAARRKWLKFGECKGFPAGPEQNVTYKSYETITLDMRPKKREDQKEESSLDKLKTNTSTSSSIVICRNCGETGHWTLKCPQRKSIKVAGVADDASGAMGAAAQRTGGGGSGKYVPMHLRSDAKKGGTSMTRDDSTTIRVTNLPEEATEHDLAELFRRFGHTSRIYLAKDRLTNLSRGFAFVTYATREAGDQAIEKLNGHGYANLILHVEWAKPRDDTRTQGDKTREILESQRRRF